MTNTIQKFLTCKIDQMFKTVIIDEKDYTLLEAILSNILGGQPKVVSLPRTVVPNTLAKEKAKDRDLVVELNDTFINLEVVTGHGEEIRSQLFTYHASMWKQNIVRGEKYDTKTKFLQIVLQFNQSVSKKLMRSYQMQHIDEETGKKDIWVKNFETLEINMTRLKKLWYNGITSEIEKYKYLIMLDLEKEELESLGKGDKIVEKYKEKVVSLNEDPNFINTITKEQERVLMANTAKSLAYEEGLNSGIAQGEKQKLNEIAKKMLQKEKSLDEISELTGLTMEEVNRISKENASLL